MSESRIFGPSTERWPARFADLLEQGANAMLFFDIKNFTEIEMRYGEEAARRVLDALDRAVAGLVAREPDVLDAGRAFGDDYLVFLRLDAAAPEHIPPLAYARSGRMLKRLVAAAEAALPSLVDRFAFHVSAVTLPERSEEAERQFYRAIKLALKLAKRRPAPEDIAEREALLRLLSRRELSVVYQPIFSLVDGSVVGYEALTRGPEGSPLHSPLKLFARAEEEGLLYLLEKLARETAIAGAGFLRPGEKLFLNVSPAVVHDPAFHPGHTRRLLEARGLSVSDTVFEVTEQQAIDDFRRFREVIDHYRRQGFRIAVDDAGAGYASFQTILALRPEFIKVDRSLIAGLDVDPVKQSLLESFVFFATKVGSRIIAEGIETAGELVQLIRLGVYAAQGFYLARPTRRPPGTPPKDAVELILRHRRILALQRRQEDAVELITAPAHTFDRRTITALVRQYLEETKDGGVVITDGGRIVGLVMREKLLQVLATQYGASLYSRRPIGLVTDFDPLVVDPKTPIDVVARLAMARPADKAYDYIIVADEGRLIGVVSIEAILNYLANVKMEAVRLANPLTGLPGNHAIDLAVREKIEKNLPFALLYVDLDRFKQYNDRYGYQRGDQVIRFLADVLKDAAARRPEADVFVGHIGGDDFVLVAPPDAAEPLAFDIVAAFERGIGFYCQEAPAPMATGRDGGAASHRSDAASPIDPPEREAPEDPDRTPIPPEIPAAAAPSEGSTDAPADGLPLPGAASTSSAERVSVSVAVVIVRDPRGLSTETLAERAAALKREVKRRPGSASLIAPF
ncbi:MAG: EAL domain-containing protein [Hydrogenibacillus schlegelii]|nr:EAL domain-containing protein [Hydrogenibacillus schlegelii]